MLTPSVPAPVVVRALAPFALLAYAGVAMAGEPFTWHTRVATGGGGLGVLALALRRGCHRLRGYETEAPPAGMAAAVGGAVWVGLLTAFAVFQLAMFLDEPRQLYPTLSSLVNEWFAAYPVRVVGFVAWLLLGWYLLRR